MSEFSTKAVSLCKCIINQRMITIKFDKSKVEDPEKIRRLTEELSKEFDKYRGSERGIAFFVKTNFNQLISITTRSHGWENRINRLKELYNQSLQIV